MRYSIVIPVYNTEKFLPRCLGSLIAQTERDFEVIVVDDCSPGDVEVIVAKFGDKFRCVHHSRNLGCFHARVTGLNAARGDFVVPLDPDDYLLPETLEKISAAIDESDPDVISYWIDYDRGGRIEPHWSRHPKAMTDGVGAILEMAEHKCMYSIVSKVVRRTVYRAAMDALGVDETNRVNTSEDFLTTLPCLMFANRVSFIEYSGYRYFVNPESITGGRRTLEGLRRACEETKYVHERVLDLACRRQCQPEMTRALERIVELSALSFVEVAMQGSPEALAEAIGVISSIFPTDKIASLLAEELARVKGSKMYRVSEFIRRIVRIK